jgi:tetratricopeptide (TPR) repeat protein
VEQLEELLHNRGLQNAPVVLPWTLDETMRTWAHSRAPSPMSEENKLRALRDGLFGSRGEPLEYAWGHTGTAQEVFETGKANCLAFTNLFVGMAREVGVPVHFLVVENLETYRREGDLVVVSDHVAVGYETGPNRSMVFDFSEYGDQDHEQVRRVRDTTAAAMFYSNRGAEALQRGELEEAARWAGAAVLLDPELATVWVNLGVVQRRRGDEERAEGCYRRALEVNPGAVSAYQNLSALLRHQGRQVEALGIEEALRRVPKRNPYSYLNLGDLSRRAGRLDEARRFYRRALGLARDDAEPLAALGRLALETGDLKEARRLLKKARKKDPENSRVVQLETLVRRAAGS